MEYVITFSDRELAPTVTHKLVVQAKPRFVPRPAFPKSRSDECRRFINPYFMDIENDPDKVGKRLNQLPTPEHVPSINRNRRFTNPYFANIEDDPMLVGSKLNDLVIDLEELDVEKTEYELQLEYGRSMPNEDREDDVTQAQSQLEMGYGTSREPLLINGKFRKRYDNPTELVSQLGLLLRRHTNILVDGSKGEKLILRKFILEGAKLEEIALNCTHHNGMWKYSRNVGRTNTKLYKSPSFSQAS